MNWIAEEREMGNFSRIKCNEGSFFYDNVGSTAAEL